VELARVNTCGLGLNHRNPTVRKEAIRPIESAPTTGPIPVTPHIYPANPSDLCILRGQFSNGQSTLTRTSFGLWEETGAPGMETPTQTQTRVVREHTNSTQTVTTPPPRPGIEPGSLGAVKQQCLTPTCATSAALCGWDCVGCRLDGLNGLLLLLEDPTTTTPTAQRIAAPPAGGCSVRSPLPQTVTSAVPVNGFGISRPGFDRSLRTLRGRGYVALAGVWSLSR